MVDTLILDLLDPEEARRPPMAMKDYSDEFKADAVALYESTPGATYKSIAADLGINRNTLRNWVLRDRARRGSGPATARDARTAARPAQLVPSAEPDERGALGVAGEDLPVRPFGLHGSVEAFDLPVGPRAVRAGELLLCAE